MREFGFQWHVTDRCNGRCAHCYQDDFDGARELGLDRLVALAGRIFAGLAGHRVTINVTGGEPLALPYLPELLRRLHDFPELAEANVISNGTIAEPAALAALAALPRFGCFKVSLEGHEAAIDDALRWPGHFAAAVGNLPAFVATGRPVVLMLTLSRRNLGCVAGIAELARARGAAGVIFERFVPLGRGLAMAGEALDAAGWRAAAEAICAAAGVDADPGELAPYRAFWVHAAGAGGDPLAGALCNLGGDSMCLMPDGTVFPCRRLPIPVGNALAEPFAAIRARLAEWAPEVTVKKITGASCGRCGVGGCAGCRAHALAVTGDPFADDPQCWKCSRIPLSK